MNHQNPFFSIIIPAFNRIEFIKSTCDSVLNQSFKNYELILIDDGSTDGTKEYCQYLYANQVRFKYFYQSNSERGSARNMGIRVSKGQYLIFLDSDDTMEKNYLDNLSRVILNNGDRFLYVPRVVIKSMSYEIESTKYIKLDGILNTDILLEGNPFACNVCIAKKSIRYFFKDERIYAGAEDWIFIFENSSQLSLYLLPFIGIIMLDHTNRSMYNHLKAINSRQHATEYLIALNKNNFRIINKLRLHKYKFLAIHYYHQNYKSHAFNSLIKYYLNSFDLLFFLKWVFKISIGVRIFNYLKNASK